MVAHTVRCIWCGACGAVHMSCGWVGSSVERTGLVKIDLAPAAMAPRVAWLGAALATAALAASTLGLWRRWRRLIVRKGGGEGGRAARTECAAATSGAVRGATTVKLAMVIDGGGHAPPLKR